MTAPGDFRLRRWDLFTRCEIKTGQTPQEQTSSDRSRARDALSCQKTHFCGSPSWAAVKWTTKHVRKHWQLYWSCFLMKKTHLKPAWDGGPKTHQNRPANRIRLVWPQNSLILCTIYIMTKNTIKTSLRFTNVPINTDQFNQSNHFGKLDNHLRLV